MAETLLRAPHVLELFRYRDKNHLMEGLPSLVKACEHKASEQLARLTAVRQNVAPKPDRSKVDVKNVH